MNDKLKIFGLGLLGGMLPLAAFVIMNGINETITSGGYCFRFSIK